MQTDYTTFTPNTNNIDQNWTKLLQKLQRGRFVEHGVYAVYYAQSYQWTPWCVDVLFNKHDVVSKSFHSFSSCRLQLSLEFTGIHCNAHALHCTHDAGLNSRYHYLTISVLMAYWVFVSSCSETEYLGISRTGFYWLN